MRFRSRGEPDFRIGFTTNVSATGMFLATRRPLPVGVEIELVVAAGEENHRCRALVARSVQVPPALQSVMASGMGLSFLGEQSGLAALLRLESEPTSPAVEPEPAASGRPSEEATPEGAASEPSIGKTSSIPASKRTPGPRLVPAAETTSGNDETREDLDSSGPALPPAKSAGDEPRPVENASSPAATKPPPTPLDENSKPPREHAQPSRERVEPGSAPGQMLAQELATLRTEHSRLKTTADTLRRELNRVHEELAKARHERDDAVGKAATVRLTLAEQLEKERQSATSMRERVRRLNAESEAMRAQLESERERRAIEAMSAVERSAGEASRDGRALPPTFVQSARPALLGVALGLLAGWFWFSWDRGAGSPPDRPVSAATLAQRSVEPNTDPDPTAGAVAPETRLAGDLSGDEASSAPDEPVPIAEADSPAPEPDVEPAEPAPPAGETVASAETPSTPTASEFDLGDDPAETSATTAPASSAASARALAERAIRGWADAWSDLRIDDYLASYSSDFEPGLGQSRQEWATARRARLGRAEDVRIELGPLDLQPSGDRWLATFRQSYRDSSYQDEVTKTLELAWEDGAWRIVAERSAPVSR